MELLKEISDKDIGFEEKGVKYKIRKSARAVLFDGDKIAILHVSKYGYHKLPGGGVKKEENLIDGLKREILEETGCTAEIKDEIGLIIEYRDEFEQIQISYCYFAKVIHNHQEQNFTEKEKSHGFVLKWTDIDTAISFIKNSKPTDYMGKFVITRDLIFLNKAKELHKF